MSPSSATCPWAVEFGLSTNSKDTFCPCFRNLNPSGNLSESSKIELKLRKKSLIGESIINQ